MATPSLGLATQAAQASTSIPRHILKQSLFFAFCPDAPDALGRRMEVRAKHWERAQVDKKDGVLFFGLGYLPPPGSSLFSHPSIPPGGQAMAGSLMIMRQPSLEDMWRRIKDDIYWTAGVWDREKCQVGEFIRHGEYVDMDE